MIFKLPKFLILFCAYVKLLSELCRKNMKDVHSKKNIYGIVRLLTLLVKQYY